jgi:hypothetical protein
VSVSKTKVPVLSGIARTGVVCNADFNCSKAVCRKELLSVVRFTQHFKHYLLGREFILRTDHNSLRWLINFKDLQGQLARWLEVFKTKVPVLSGIARTGVVCNADFNFSKAVCCSSPHFHGFFLVNSVNGAAQGYLSDFGSMESN